MPYTLDAAKVLASLARSLLAPPSLLSQLCDNQSEPQYLWEGALQRFPRESLQSFSDLVSGF